MREITDRREAYYERAAAHIAADPLSFYTRAERGRTIQGGIQPKDLDFDRIRKKLAPKPVPAIDRAQQSWWRNFGQ